MACLATPKRPNKYKNEHKIKISKFINFKIKWPKSMEKVENGDRLGPVDQNSPPPPTGPLDLPVNEVTGY